MKSNDKELATHRSSIENGISKLETQSSFNEKERNQLIESLKEPLHYFQKNKLSAFNEASQFGTEIKSGLNILEAIANQANFAIFLRNMDKKYLFVNKEW